ncbi:MAG: hypothetical protein JXB10_11080 [Pirellulales bacterium]|nr:hypothetical protein [Pirellulales bacterium]
MIESKIELTERLRREGRWAEASKFKDTALKEFRSKGMKKAEASEEAWSAMEKAYPPLPTPVEPEHRNDVSDAEGRTAVLVGSSPLPASWGEIPESAPFDAEVEWVHQNRILVVEERPSGKPMLHWERAQSPAPSHGARGLMEFAATNRKGFMDILQRVKPGGSGDEVEIVKRAKRGVEEIRRMISERMEDETEKLAANVPETVKAKVRGILEDWERRYAPTIPNEAKADLEAHVAGLVQECLDAALKVSEREEQEEKKVT